MYLLLLLYCNILMEILPHSCVEIKLCISLVVVLLSAWPLQLMSMGLYNLLLLHTFPTNVLWQGQGNNRILDDTSKDWKVFQIHLEFNWLGYIYLRLANEWCPKRIPNPLWSKQCFYIQNYQHPRFHNLETSPLYLIHLLIHLLVFDQKYWNQYIHWVVL